MQTFTYIQASQVKVGDRIRTDRAGSLLVARIERSNFQKVGDRLNDRFIAADGESIGYLPHALVRVYIS
jgi:hypothetical protein